jgi:hypothetical protein
MSLESECPHGPGAERPLFSLEGTSEVQVYIGTLYPLVEIISSVEGQS